MFLIGETVDLPGYGTVEVSSVALKSLTVNVPRTGAETLPLNAHDYRKLLMLEPQEPEITHYAPINGKYVYELLGGLRVAVKRYGDRYQWTLGGKGTSALQVWKHVYGLEVK